VKLADRCIGADNVTRYGRGVIAMIVISPLPGP